MKIEFCQIFGDAQFTPRCPCKNFQGRANGVAPRVKGAGVLRSPTLKIKFLGFLDTGERELLTGFYRIKKYCSWALAKVMTCQSWDASVFTVHVRILIASPEK